jgi:hypothetical protein
VKSLGTYTIGLLLAASLAISAACGILFHLQEKKVRQETLQNEYATMIHSLQQRLEKKLISASPTASPLPLRPTLCVLSAHRTGKV